MGLYQKHRPASLDEVKGNRNLIVTLRSMLKDKTKFPHTLLFVGGTGCGKTTLARIIASELECSGNNLIEIDTAQFNGIDTVRDIRKSAQFTPLGGGNRVYIIDECFHPLTQIETPTGKKSIEDFKVGDSVMSLYGKDIVTNVFINKVELERVVFLRFDNGSSLLCSKDHLFFTKNGWVKACELQKNNLLLHYVSDTMPNIDKQLNDKRYETQENSLHGLRKQTEQKTEKNVFLEMFSLFNREKQGSTNKDRTTGMPYLWKAYHMVLGQARQIQQAVLQQCLCWEIQHYQQYWASTFNGIQAIDVKENVLYFESYGNRKSYAGAKFTENEKEQSFLQYKEYRKGNGNKTHKWFSACLERCTWRKWNINRPSKITSFFTRLANGSGGENRAHTKGWFWLSNLLQSRYWKFESKISNRNRRCWTQIEKSYINRFEKNRNAEFVRVESIAFYERRSDEQCFESLITDKERSQGFINFYDLEVRNHPSYFASEIAVHNCHKLSTDAQNGFLKILEDTPPHIYFILCTTNEKSLLPTIIGRCSKHQVSQLSDEEMTDLLNEVTEKEEKQLEKEVCEMIVKSAQGHPRNALTILEQVLSTPSKRRMQVAEQIQLAETEGIELARALYGRKKWTEVSKILKNLKANEDPEGVRRLVMGYASSILLNKDDSHAAIMLECFAEPFYNTGFSGLVLASYTVIKG